MKYKLLRVLKSISAFVLSAVMLSVSVSAAPMYEYTTPGMSDEKQAEYILDSVVMRVGCNEGYIDNKRLDLREGFKDIRPYLTNDTVYVPIDFVLDGLGIEFEKSDDNVYTFTYEAKSYTLAEGQPLNEGSDILIQRQKRVLFATVEEVKEFFDLICYTDKDIIIFSKTNDKINSIPEKTMTELKRLLSYEWDWVYEDSDGFQTGIVANPWGDMYLRTDVGGMYRWNEEAQKWIQLAWFADPDHYMMSGVSGLAVDWNNRDVVYAAAGGYTYADNTYLMKSEDRGKTWRAVLEAHFGGNQWAKFGHECVYVDPNNSNVVYCGSNVDGFFMSKDAGETWERNVTVPNSPQTISEGYRGINVVYVDKTSPIVDGRSSDVYVGVWGDGVYKSSNGGRTFERMEGSGERVYQIERLNGRLFMSFGNRSGAKGAGFYEYKDGEWIDLTPKTNAGERGMSCFIMDRTNPDFMIVRSEPYNPTYQFISRDGGKTWKKSNRSDVHGSGLLQHPNDPKKLILLHGFRSQLVEDMYADKWVSKDFTWGIEELVTARVMSNPAPEAPRLLAGFMDKNWKVLERLDTSYEPEPPYGGANAGFAFCQAEPNFVVAAMATGYEANGLGQVYLSENYGKTGSNFPSESWQPTNQPIDCAVSATLYDNGYPIVIVPVSVDDDACLYRTSDWGKTWEKLPDVKVKSNSSFSYSQDTIEADKVDGKTFYYCDKGDFYVTTDGGDSWTLKRSFPARSGGYYLRAVPGVKGNVWYEDANKNIMVTTDKGDSWYKMEGVSNVRSFGFGKGKPDSKLPAAYVFGTVNGVYGIFISDDLGKTWNRINDDRNSFINSVHTLEGDKQYYGRVYASCEGNGAMYGQPILFDDHEPVITVDTKGSSNEKDVNYAVMSDTFRVEGSVNEKSEVRINGKTVPIDGDFKFSTDVKLEKYGDNLIYIEAVDNNNNKAETKFLNVRYMPDYIGVEYDMDEFIGSKTGDVRFKGRVSGPVRLIADGRQIKINPDNTFDSTLKFEKGEREIEVYAESLDGKYKSDVKKFTVRVDDVAPVITPDAIPELVEDSYYILTGTINEMARMRVNKKEINLREGNRFSKYIKLHDGINEVEVQALDVAGNVSKPEIIEIKAKVPPAVDTSKLEANRVPSGYVMDGNLSEWGALPHKAENMMVGDSNNVVRFNVAWDEEYLYVAAEVYDDIIVGGNTTAHLNDCIEVFVDGDYHRKGHLNEHDEQFVFPVATPNNYDRQRSAYVLTDNGYTIEVRIPWSSLDMPPAYSGQVLGFDFASGDNDGTKINDRDGSLSFNDKQNEGWNVVDVYATLTLK